LSDAKKADEAALTEYQAALTNPSGVSLVGRNRVMRLMQLEGLRARARKWFKCTTVSDHEQPVADNMLGRNFEADAPNQRWVGDTTEMLTLDGAKFYLAAIIDLYSRLCVGWAVSAVNDRHLCRRRMPRRVSEGSVAVLLGVNDQAINVENKDALRKYKSGL